MAPNTQVDLTQSSVGENGSPPSPTIEQLDPVTVATNKDAEQRKRTDRAKGWYDYQIMFYSPSYVMPRSYPHILGNLVSEELGLLKPTYENNWLSNRWTEVPPTDSGDTSSVVLLRLPPNPYGRSPNLLGFDNCVKQSDAVVLTPSALKASEQLNVLKHSLLREPDQYDDYYRDPNERIVTWTEGKRLPVVFLLPTPQTEESIQRKEEIKELKKKGEDVLLIEANFNSREEMQDALSQILHYARSNRGILGPVPAAPPPRKFSRLNFLSRSSTKKEPATATEKTSRSRLFGWRLSSFFSSKE